MPNWCHNRIHFTGMKKDMDDLMDKIVVPPAEREPVDPLTRIGGSSHFADNAIDLTRARPRPDDIGDNWYQWSVEHWGTKWAPDMTLVSAGVHEVEMVGDSAWGPPSELVRFITGHFMLGAVITFDEPGMEFAGAEAYVWGKLVYDGCFRYENVPGIENARPDWDADDYYDKYDTFQTEVFRETESHEDAAHACLLEVWAKNVAGKEEVTA